MWFIRQCMVKRCPMWRNKEYIYNSTMKVCFMNMAYFLLYFADNFALVIGLGVGIPLFFIAVLLAAIVIIYATKMKKRRHRYRTEEYDRWEILANNTSWLHVMNSLKTPLHVGKQGVDQVIHYFSSLNWRTWIVDTC